MWQLKNSLHKFFLNLYYFYLNKLKMRWSLEEHVVQESLFLNVNATRTYLQADWE